MGLVHAGLLTWMFYSVCSSQVRREGARGWSVHYPELEWERTATEMSKETIPAPAPKTKLGALATQFTTPAPKQRSHYLIISGTGDQTETFMPGQGSGPVPSSVANILLGSPSNTLPVKSVTDPKGLVEMLCHVDRMYVRIKRKVFKTLAAYRYLKLGTCPVNAGTNIHYYFLYLLSTDCGFQQQSKADYVYISNVLSYEPTTPVLREMPFRIPLLCKYPRYFYSYKPGFYPTLQEGTFFKPLDLMDSLTLTPRDALGIAITGVKTYAMGELMYFEAKQPVNTGSSGAQRIYINTCVVTATPNPNSSPKYTLIDNQGCMIDGKMANESMFLTGSSNTALTFRVAAFIFRGLGSAGSAQRLFMHCDIAMGTLTPTPSAKACNYDQATATWNELYGAKSVCSCCDSVCPSAQPVAFKTISSRSWKVDLSGDDKIVEMNPADKFSLEDPYSSDHRDFLAYWEQNYRK